MILAIVVLSLLAAMVPRPHSLVVAGDVGKSEPLKIQSVIEPPTKIITFIPPRPTGIDFTPIATPFTDAMTEFDTSTAPMNVKIATLIAAVEQPESIESIEELFDMAWQSGTRTYSGLIEFVRQKTGTGTSKSRVKKWKVDRGLLDE